MSHRSRQTKRNCTGLPWEGGRALETHSREGNPMPKAYKKRVIKQIIPAQPGTWALYGEKKTLDFTLPVVCWALVEEDQYGQQVIAQTLGEHGLGYCDDDDGYMGIAVCGPNEQPPNARRVLLTAGDMLPELKELKLMD